MFENESRLTVYFEGPFWVGVYERVANGRLEACKITFGAEPKDNEIYAFLLQNWAGLVFSPAVEANAAPKEISNPKRRRRVAKKQLEAAGMGTKSQQALGLLREEGKRARRQKTRADKEAETQRRFEQRQQKRKEKHRGH